MLCLSGFELYSRWVPCFKIDYRGSVTLQELLVYFNVFKTPVSKRMFREVV